MANRKRKQKSGSKKRTASSGQRVRPVSGDLPELQKARALWMKNRFKQSLDLFHRAVRKNPGNTLALTDAARAFGARFEFARAEALIERLVEISGGRADLLQMAGQSYRMIQRPMRAIECLEKALESSANLFEARLELALLYERRHQLEEASEQVDAALARNPESQEARFLAGRIARRRGDSSEAEQALQDVAANNSAHWITRTQAWHELGQLYDEAGEYDQAFEAVCHGKQVADRHADQFREKSVTESNRLKPLHAELTAKDFDNWRRMADERNRPAHPMALLTGAPRSGTTLLEKVLDSHPGIVTSDEQEAFNKFILPSLLIDLGPDDAIHPADLTELPTERIEAERQRYWRYMADSLGEEIGDRFHIDKNPSTIMLIPGMLRLFPECKLLVALRDPRDVVVSCFMRYLPLNTVSVQFLTVAGAAERYTRDMRGWLHLREIIGSPWKEVRYEETVEDLQGEARKVVDFLGIAWDDEVMSYRDHMQRRQVNSPTYEAVAKPVYRSAIGRWKNYEKHLGEVTEILNPLVQQFGYA